MRASEILSAMTWAALNIDPDITAARANAIDTEIVVEDTVVVAVVVTWGFNVAMQLKILDLKLSL